MAINECASKLHRDRACEISENRDYSSLSCFPLGSEARKKGVASGVPMSVKPESFRDIAGVCEARRLTRLQDGEKEDSHLLCLTFERELPEVVSHEYVSNRVRPYERVPPLRCFCCQEYIRAVRRSHKMWEVTIAVRRSAKQKKKSKQSTCTVREITMRDQHSVLGE